MCIAVPVTITAINGPTAQATAPGGRLTVDARLIPTAKPGDKALVHAGVAIGLISAEEARGIEDLYQDVLAGPAT